jgi:hypothetical protein
MRFTRAVLLMRIARIDLREQILSSSGICASFPDERHATAAPELVLYGQSLFATG